MKPICLVSELIFFQGEDKAGDKIQWLLSQLIQKNILRVLKRQALHKFILIN